MATKLLLDSLNGSMSRQKLSISNEGALVYMLGSLWFPATTSDAAKLFLLVNDNAPTFSTENYVASIPEDIPVGTPFMQVAVVLTISA